MTVARIALSVAILAMARPVFSTPALETGPHATSMSVFAHTINNRAEAHSIIYELDHALTANVAVTAEVDSIGDHLGSTSIENVYLRRRIGRLLPREPRFAGYVGIARVAVRDNFGESSHKSGVTVGVISDVPTRAGLTLYGRAGISFLNENLWTLDAGVRYEVRPRWFLSMGYRQYIVGSSSLGGFLAGATRTF